MNNPLRIKCDEVMDEIFGSSGKDEVPLLQRLGTAKAVCAQLRISLHLFFCTRCSEEVRKLEIIKEMGKSDFFPPAPSFIEEKVMGQLSSQLPRQFDEGFPQDEALGELVPEVPGGFSFRSWVIIGFIILVSLGTSFFGIDFIQAAFNRDSSFLIPMGITVGIVLTGYGAFFIASHLKELSGHFKIH